MGRNTPQDLVMVLCWTKFFSIVVHGIMTTNTLILWPFSVHVIELCLFFLSRHSPYSNYSWITSDIAAVGTTFSVFGYDKIMCWVLNLLDVLHVVTLGHITMISSNLNFIKFTLFIWHINFTSDHIHVHPWTYTSLFH